MDARIRREALKAAAKVALSVAAISSLGCGGETTPGLETKADPNRSPEPATPVGANGPIDAGLAATDEPALDFSACEVHLESLHPDAGLYPGTPFSVTDQNLACCKRVLDDDRIMESPVRWDCCQLVDVPQACTPWGPPMPPMMTS